MNWNWPSRTLGDLVSLQRGHDLTEEQRKPGIVPVVGSAGQNGTHSQARATGPGVTLGRSGASIGKVTYIPTDYWPHNTCIYVTDFKGNNPRFVAYLLSTLDLAQLNSGAAQPSLNRNFVYGVKLRYPGRNEQDRIADILEKEKAIYRAQMENSGKPANVIEKIVEGKLGAYYEQVVLVDQQFVIRPEAKQTVAQAVAAVNKAIGASVAITRFARLKVGEAAQ